MPTPSGGVHNCPGCGAGDAERRTPRGRGERLRAALTGRRPYRCLRCGRRFFDRPSHPVGREPEATAPGPALQRRRQAYWRVDIRAGGLRPADVYLVVLVVLIVGAVAASVLLLLWRTR